MQLERPRKHWVSTFLETISALFVVGCLFRTEEIIVGRLEGVIAGNDNCEIVGNWNSPLPWDIKEFEDRLRPGDRLEFHRGVYEHWGIYVGEYEGMKHAVIHFGMFEGGSAFSKKKAFGSSSAASQKPEIRADTIAQILGSCSMKVRINNSRDKEVEPLDLDVIIGVAKIMHRQNTPREYSLFSNNCEHFVNLCRYGEPYSAQAVEAVLTVVFLSLGAIIAFCEFIG
ncbi:phospholipase A and acyltransferase 4-like [Patiria miniata]|uniref:LRAT domain-containing protein n=1 Tax=Patiria miniata TaxID=46514 RepID=A0A914AQT2_PATMI|nr:phospholipase A and acyltransferase 4-like [Patiria miniata]